MLMCVGLAGKAKPAETMAERICTQGILVTVANQHRDATTGRKTLDMEKGAHNIYRWWNQIYPLFVIVTLF